MKKIVKSIVFLGFFPLWLLAENNITVKTNIYEGNCLPCHQNNYPATLERMFMSYIKVYSGERTLKSALKGYLRNPEKKDSVMSDMFIKNFGIKEKTKLSKENLDEAIDFYWDLYNVRNKLR